MLGTGAYDDRGDDSGDMVGDKDLLVNVGESEEAYVGNEGDELPVVLGAANVPTINGKSTVMNCDFVPSDVV